MAAINANEMDLLTLLLILSLLNPCKDSLMKYHFIMIGTISLVSQSEHKTRSKIKSRFITKVAKIFLLHLKCLHHK